METIRKIKSILTEPNVFFKSLVKEKTGREAFIYLLKLSLFSIIVGNIANIFFGAYTIGILSQLLNLPIPMPQYGFETVLSAMVLGYILTIIGSFIGAGLLHVWILIFGGKEKYEKTYQLYIYSSTPGFVFGWIPFVSFFAQIYGLFLLIVGTQHIHKISKTRAILMYVIPFVLIYILIIALIMMVISIISSNPDLFSQQLLSAMS